MAQQTIDIGSAPNDGTGDPIRDAFDKINDNFTELYAADAALGTAAALDVDTDGTLAANSDSLIPTQQAVKEYVDANAGGASIEVLDEGVSETAALLSLDFVGAGVTANDDGSGNVTVTIPGGGGGVDVEDEGVSEATGVSVLNFTGAGVTATDAGGGQVDIDIPGSGGGWTLVDQTGAPAAGSSTWAWSANVAQVDVTGLGSYNELLIIAIGVSTAAGGNVRCIRVSVDNGSSFYSGASDYTVVDISGTTSGTNSFINHGSTSTAARTITGHIKNLKGPVKIGVLQTNIHRYFSASANDIDAIRLTDTAGANLTAGTLYVYAR